MAGLGLTWPSHPCVDGPLGSRAMLQNRRRVRVRSCVDGPLGSRAMLQNRRRVRVRSCVRPCGAVEMTAAQMGSASEPSTRLRFRTAPSDGTGYLAHRFDRSSSSSAVALSPAMPAVQAAVAGRYASPLVIMAHTTRAFSTGSPRSRGEDTFGSVTESNHRDFGG
jgi:hypothetical protein